MEQKTGTTTRDTATDRPADWPHAEGLRETTAMLAADLALLAELTDVDGLRVEVRYGDVWVWAHTVTAASVVRAALDRSPTPTVENVRAGGAHNTIRHGTLMIGVNREVWRAVR